MQSHNGSTRRVCGHPRTRQALLEEALHWTPSQCGMFEETPAPRLANRKWKVGNDVKGASYETSTSTISS